MYSFRACGKIAFIIPCMRLKPLFTLALLVALAGCAAPEQPEVLPTLPPVNLQPYQTRLPGTASPTPGPSPTPLPTATPVPRTYTLRSSDTLFGLSLFYGVSVDEILAANPGLDRNILPPGKEIIIPPTKGDPSFTPTPQPTPMDLPSGKLTCYAARDGGIWCFLPVTNNQERPLESVSAEIQIAAADGSSAQILNAYSLLNLIPPGVSLPLAAYFPPPQPGDFRAAARLSAALPLAEGDTRYLSVNLETRGVEIDPGGRSARIDALVRLPADAQASRVWLAAIAYDSEGDVVGVRRKEMGSKNAPLSGELEIRFSVYSLAGKIERVEVFAEARP